MNSPLDVRDALVEGAVEEQKKRGMVPTVAEAQAEFARILTQLESKPGQKVTKTERRHDLQDEAEKRADARGRATTFKNVQRETNPVQPPKPADIFRVAKKYEGRLRARLRLLRSKPDWAAKLRRINPFALQGNLGAQKKREAEEAVRAVILASNATFGDWRKPPAKPLRFDLGGGKR